MKFLLRVLLLLFGALGLAIVIARLLFPPPPALQREASVAMPAATIGPLASVFEPMTLNHRNQSGILPLANGLDAFSSRLMLLNQATTSIDARYYIWHRDMTGILLMQALVDAAQRGVRVRLLVDDNGVSDFDEELAAMAQHPNMEVRIFNPFMMRSVRVLNYAFDFFRLNRRMHNKSITVDGVATVLGGRNIGDEYFSAGQGNYFADLDVLAIGPVVQQSNTDFDRYWASPSAIPAQEVISEQSVSFAKLRQEVEQVLASEEYAAYRQQMANTYLSRQIMSRGAPFTWASAHLYSDDPLKGKGSVSDDKLMIYKVAAAIGTPRQQFSLVSPYFIPGNQGVTQIAQWADQGVDVNILTNAFEATDVAAVHAGYIKYRRNLLEHGVHLYEMHRSIGQEAPEDRVGLTGSSASSLHAKTFAVDGQRLFVGSFNFDPRSLLLNCEMGLLIDSPELASELHRFFNSDVPTAAYQVSFGQNQSLHWALQNPDKSRTFFEKEPETTWLSRAAMSLIGWLPVEWLL